MDLSTEQFDGIDWMPDPSEHNLQARATRSMNGISAGYYQRQMMNQPAQGLADADVERRTYGFFNVRQTLAPETTNPFEREQERQR